MRAVVALAAAGAAAVLGAAGAPSPARADECAPTEGSTLAAADCSVVPVVPSLDPAWSDSFVPPPPPPARRSSPAGACRPLSAVFYAPTDWFRLAQKLRGDPSACAEYYV